MMNATLGVRATHAIHVIHNKKCNNQTNNTNSPVPDVQVGKREVFSITTCKCFWANIAGGRGQLRRRDGGKDAASHS